MAMTPVITELPLDELVVDENEVVKPSKRFMASIKKEGVLIPIKVAPLPGTPQRYLVIAGRRRVLSARAAEFATIPAIIDEADAVRASQLALIENNQRAANHLSDLQALERLLESGMTEQEIAQQYGLTIAQVRARLKLRRLTPEMRLRLEEGKLLPTVAARVARLPQQVQNQVAEEVGTGPVTFNIVKAARQVHASKVVAAGIPSLSVLMHESSPPAFQDERAYEEEVTLRAQEISRAEWDARRYVQQAVEILPPDHPARSALEQSLDLIGMLGA